MVALAVHAAGSSAPKVLLTREEGKNDKLRNALTAKGFQCVELPLIEHSDGPDRWGYLSDLGTCALAARLRRTTHSLCTV